MAISIKRKSQMILGFMLLFFICVGCTYKSDDSYQPTVDNSAPAEFEPNIVLEQNPEKENTKNYMFFGTWILSEVVLKTAGYSDDITKNQEVIPFEVEDYIGQEIEFTPLYVRIDDEKCLDPQYTIKVITSDEYQALGAFHRTTENDLFAGKPYFPSATQFFLQFKENEIDESFEYITINYDYFDYRHMSLDEILIEIDKDPNLEHYFNPLGRGFLLLDDDIMLVGTWGKIILAYKVND